MFFDEEIENFGDDGFEGSNDERCIFREVFFGYQAESDRQRKIPGAFNSGCAPSKNANSSICSNSDSSALTSQSSPKLLCLPESINVNDDARGNTAVRCFSEDFSLQEMSDSNVYVKHTNLLFEKPSGTVIDEKILNSSRISGESMSPHGADSVFHTITFPLVESFCQGVAWNYYLLKQNMQEAGEVSMGVTDPSNCRFLGSDGNLGKEVHASKVIASPVSQESYATKLLVASPSPCVGGQLEYPEHAHERTMEYDVPGLGWSNSVETDAAKDPRRLLFSYALDLLKDAGWLVTKHKRPCRRYLESKYRSPTGRSFREFPKVWKACGEILLADRFVLVQQDDDTGWNNISLFFSDLYDTLLSVKKEQNQPDISSSLIHQWNFLNPFVTIIFIDKKIGMLRKGQAVKARRSLLIDKYEKRNVVIGLRRADDKDRGRRSVFALKCGDVNGSKFAQGQLSGLLSYPAESKLGGFDDGNEKRDTVLGLKCEDLKANLLFGGQLAGPLSHQAERKVRLYDGRNEKRDTVMGLKCGDLKANLLFGGQFPGLFSDWTHLSGGEVTIHDGKADAFEKQSHGEYFPQCSWPGTERTAGLLSGTSCYMPSIKGNTFDTESYGANVLPGVCNAHVLLSSGSACSLPDAFGTFSPHSNGNISFSSGRKNVERRGHLVEDMAIVAWESKDKLSEDQGTDKMEQHLIASQDSCLNCCNSCFSTGCKSCKMLSESADLVDSNDKSEVGPKVLPQEVEPETPVYRTSDIMEQLEDSGKERHQCSVVDVILKKKIRRKSKKISEIKSTELHQTQIVGETSDKAEPLDVHVSFPQSVAPEAISQGSCKSSLSFPDYHIMKKRPKHKKIRLDCDDMDRGKKRSRKCEIDDDDLLVSAIIKNKEIGPSPCRSKPKVKGKKSSVRRMMKSKTGGCRLLLRQLGKGGKLSSDGKWSLLGARTVLSWLINSGVISPEDVIQYRDPKDKTLVKDGRITMDGIICSCCNEVLSFTQFKIHSGFKQNRPCLNIFMESGEPLTLCELQAWSSEYKNRKSGTITHQADENDQNDDSCGLCGDGGELICCDNCPSTFHQACLLTEDLPEGNWYCANCTCRICGDLVNALSSDARKCLQCEHKYHESCMKEKELDPVASDAWFCGGSCQEIHSGLHSRIGLINHIADGYSWTLLRCIHDDQKVHSAQRFALKAECNSKLAVALSIVEECFASMVDPRTGIDMIPHVLYNWGSEFARLNFQGFYTMVLEKDDVLITAASIRLHGVAVAEMPLIATCSKYRRQGMCRRLMTALEELLISLKVEKLVIAAIPEVLETWTEGFGFEIVGKDEKQSLNKINLMVFPGTVLLKKPLLQRHQSDTRTVAEHAGPDYLPVSSTELNAGTGQPAENCCTERETEANIAPMHGTDPPNSAEVSPKEDFSIKSEHQPGEEPRRENSISEEENDREEGKLMQEDPERDDQAKIVEPEELYDVVRVGPELAASGCSGSGVGLEPGSSIIMQDQFSKPSCSGSVCNAGVTATVHDLSRVSLEGRVSETL